MPYFSGRASLAQISAAVLEFPARTSKVTVRFLAFDLRLPRPESVFTAARSPAAGQARISPPVASSGLVF